MEDIIVELGYFESWNKVQCGEAIASWGVMEAWIYWVACGAGGQGSRMRHVIVIDRRQLRLDLAIQNNG